MCQLSIFSPFLLASTTPAGCSSVSLLETLWPFSHWHRHLRAKVSSSLGAQIVITYTIHCHLRIATWPLTFQYPNILIGAKDPRPIAEPPPINFSLWGTATIGVSQKIPVLSSSVHFLLLLSKECPLGLSGEYRQMKSSLISRINPS